MVKQIFLKGLRKPVLPVHLVLNELDKFRKQTSLESDQFRSAEERLLCCLHFNDWPKSSVSCLVLQAVRL